MVRHAINALATLLLLTCIGLVLLWTRTRQPGRAMPQDTFLYARGGWCAEFVSRRSWTGHSMLGLGIYRPWPGKLGLTWLSGNADSDQLGPAIACNHTTTYFFRFPSQRIGFARTDGGCLVLYPDGTPLLTEPAFKGRRTAPVTVWTLAMPHAYAVVLALSLPVLWTGYRAIRSARCRRRSASGRCVRCAYDLRASDSRCPECGEPIASRDQISHPFQY